jgi:hypothetical protein
MTNPIHEAEQELERLRLQSIENRKRGIPDTIWGPSSCSLSQAWNVTYQRWMDLRADAGNAFLRALGYGTHT